MNLPLFFALVVDLKQLSVAGFGWDGRVLLVGADFFYIFVGDGFLENKFVLGFLLLCFCELMQLVGGLLVESEWVVLVFPSGRVRLHGLETVGFKSILPDQKWRLQLNLRTPSIPIKIQGLIGTVPRLTILLLILLFKLMNIHKLMMPLRLLF